jgi:hypothetical protein
MPLPFQVTSLNSPLPLSASLPTHAAVTSLPALPPPRPGSTANQCLFCFQEVHPLLTPPASLPITRPTWIPQRQSLERASISLAAT